ncbi:hypothetical protein RhiirA5_443119 [Rhizophagus irregularis]|uniref:Uncharacterized protein n=1 Tax=Rhizophagus irregularis TaxID=588596 RepID=A0A2N0NE58_9GLOM|nr:hypothetical protein RhiirA5_443119 [Rhizophagus irregularis]
MDTILSKFKDIKQLSILVIVLHGNIWVFLLHIELFHLQYEQNFYLPIKVKNIR